MKTAPLFGLVLSVLLAQGAHAQVVAFVPPGAVVLTTHNSNDSWAQGRGVLFSPTANLTIDTIGVFQQLRPGVLGLELSRVHTDNGLIYQDEILWQGSVSTTGADSLSWLDLALPDTCLRAGYTYHAQFSYFGRPYTNFFYDNQNQPFAQDHFAQIDGTEGKGTANYVMPAVRLNVTSVSPVPEPATYALIGLGLLGVMRARRNPKA
ncbi:PEP-CTERM sorting domain-containing protein [Chitiniphilus eburneus]|uniref:PEP-CTERM sorting domain-containing protein n=1 Tax=Chitiniphilus eburneus TaxID=2571148 RepID=A0A4V5MQW3_9NEIS|nr:PEP-CTERM sorting domain-containing protein [Chitiniphilus eburneus]TJZ74078.1 PEP-CTERM sorting domain-containing protein [Chitiniphilus eburneus]